ncbi:hypothetical protein ES703_56497 [subsurface metagenome]
MALSCGCELKAGAPIDYVTLRAHYRHTLEALVFWELIFRKDQDLSEGRMKLSQARFDLFRVIDELFPEASKEGL